MYRELQQEASQRGRGTHQSSSDVSAQLSRRAHTPPGMSQLMAIGANTSLWSPHIPVGIESPTPAEAPHARQSASEAPLASAAVPRASHTVTNHKAQSLPPVHSITNHKVQSAPPVHSITNHKVHAPSPVQNHDVRQHTQQIGDKHSFDSYAQRMSFTSEEDHNPRQGLGVATPSEEDHTPRRSLTVTIPSEEDHHPRRGLTVTIPSEDHHPRRGLTVTIPSEDHHPRREGLAVATTSKETPSLATPAPLRFPTGADDAVRESTPFNLLTPMYSSDGDLPRTSLNTSVCLRKVQAI